MKKLLALVLALVMTLGLATVGSNAANWSDLKDKDTVSENRQEAFQVLNAIKVFEGDENNNLNPGKQLTRAEAAKIIATLNLGKTTAESLPKNGGKFSDVADSNWASGYISYCESMGIIAGNGDGTFNPQGDLTVAAFTKMLLVSLGYNAETEKFVGADWQINTIALANKVALFNGFDGTLVATDKVTRADAAQMAFNTLKTPLVTYANYGIMGQYNNPIPSNAAQGTAVYMTTAARDTQTISTATINDGSARGTYMVEFAEQNFPKLTRNTHDVDDWGRPATTWTLDRELVGTYNNTDLLVFEKESAVKGSEIYEALGGSTFLRMYANDLTESSVVYNVFEDGVKLTGDARTAVVSKIVANGGAIGMSGVGTQVEVYIDDDTYYNYGVTTTNTAKIPVVTIVAINTWLANVMTDADAKKAVKLGIYTADDSAEVVDATVTKDYKDGDWVLVKFTRDDNTVREITDPVISKGVTSTKYTTSGAKMATVTVDGEVHKITRTAHTDSKILNTYYLRQLKGFTYDLYMDESGNIYGIQYNTTDTNLVFVTGYEKASSVLAATTVKANLIFTDGTMKTDNEVIISTAEGSNAQTALAAKENATLNSWFTYTSDDNGKITLVNKIAVSSATATATDGMYFQYADAAANNSDTDTDISTIHPTFAYNNKAGDAGLRAIADDNTIFVRAAADAKYVTDGAITKTLGCTKGIKNTSIVSASPKGMANFKTWNDAPVWSDVFFVFDTNQYVIAAVALTENVAADHLAYITKLVKEREVVAGVGYVDTYEAILDGETVIKDLKVASQQSGYDTQKKLSVQTLYGISYDKNNEYVIYAAAADNKSDKLDTLNNKTRGYAVAHVGDMVGATSTASLKYGDSVSATTTNMLYANDKDGEHIGHIAAETKGNFWVLKNGEYERYNNLKQAYEQATHAVDGVAYTLTGIYAMTNKGTGFATTAILISTKAGDASTLVGSDKVVVVKSDAENNFDGTWFYTEAYDKDTKNTKKISLSEMQDALTSWMVQNNYKNIKWGSNAVGANTVTYTLNGTEKTVAYRNWAQVYKVTVLGDTKDYYRISTAAYRNAVTVKDVKVGDNYDDTATAVAIVKDATKDTTLQTKPWTAIGANNKYDVTIAVSEKNTELGALQALLDAYAKAKISGMEIKEDKLATAMTTAPNKLTVPAGITLTVDGDYNLAVGETIVVKGTLKVKGNLDLDGHIDVEDGGALVVTGTTDISGASLVLKEGAEATLTGAVTVTGGLTIEAKATLSAVKGLTINETENKDVTIAGTLEITGTGADLTITKLVPAKTSITGTIVVADDVNVNDDVTLGGGTLTAEDVIVATGKTLTVEGKTAVELTTLTIDGNGKVTVTEGSIEGGKLETKAIGSTLTVGTAANKNTSVAFAETDNAGKIVVNTATDSTHSADVDLGKTTNESTGTIDLTKADSENVKLAENKNEDPNSIQGTDAKESDPIKVISTGSSLTKKSGTYVTSGDTVTVKFDRKYNNEGKDSDAFVKAHITVTAPKNPNAKVSVTTWNADSIVLTFAGIDSAYTDDDSASKITIKISGIEVADGTTGAAQDGTATITFTVKGENFGVK